MKRDENVEEGEKNSMRSRRTGGNMRGKKAVKLDFFKALCAVLNTCVNVCVNALLYV